ncbi:SprT family zinc-dependent metalloprotease [Lysobacter sp. A03]|uniref:YgjP family zinc-dependent metalloprotease n=1 Tax=Lysobacter sp. A03 TaxID=1199154 RepID=UPI0005B70335|nr:SprT family zinc-dependent metalloprotease [Lysobacter sp. A03]KIQ96627.1 putative metal-dependent hydrolase [Lysobacter sp. A03]
MLRRLQGLARTKRTPARRAVQRDTFELTLDDGRSLEVERRRDPRARRIKLSVSERGARVTLPPRASASAAARFAHEHRQWLAVQLELHTRDVPPPLLRDVSATLPLRDAERPLRWERGRFTRIESAPDDRLVFLLPERAGPAAQARALRDFYEGEARADLARWLPDYLDGLPRAPRQFRFKLMSSRWGSLAPDDSVALDRALVLARPSAYRYVLVHELCHLLQANHSAAFWAEVETRMPRWREEREYLRLHGSRLKATMRSLLAAGTETG